MADPVNDEKEEDRLWEEYRKTKSQSLRDAFIRQYMPLVKYVAGKVAVGMPGNVEFDDLVGFGQFGLLDAIEKYDPSKNVKFIGTSKTHKLYKATLCISSSPFQLLKENRAL